MLRTRVISALFLVPAVVGAVYIGGTLFAVLVILVLGLAAYEFVRLMQQGGYQPMVLLAWAGVLLSVAANQNLDARWFRPAISGLFVSSLVWQLFQKDRPAPTADWALSVAGGLYIGWMGGHLVALRQVSNGFKWLMLTLLVTWLADSGAYFVGSTWGRRKLVPRLSPGKTWEGTLGGWATGVGWGALVAWLFGIGAVHGLVLGALVGLVSPLGDLAISMMKRQVGAKDSSHLIPGHGGMLDRIDSVLFTVVVSYYYIVWVPLG